MTLPTMAALAVVGAGAGVFLGKSAVGEINPAHYAAPQTAFYADLVPGRPDLSAQPTAPSEAMAFGFSDYGTGGPLLHGTPDYPEDYRPEPDPMIELVADPATVSDVGYEVATIEAPVALDPEAARIAAYASFPIAPAIADEEAVADPPAVAAPL